MRLRASGAPWLLTRNFGYEAARIRTFPDTVKLVWYYSVAMDIKTERKNLNLRLPLDIHRAMVEEADKNDRSLNSEIVARLRASLRGYRKF